jgi:hypothetical protein
VGYTNVVECESLGLDPGFVPKAFLPSVLLGSGVGSTKGSSWSTRRGEPPPPLSPTFFPLSPTFFFPKSRDPAGTEPAPTGSKHPLSQKVRFSSDSNLDARAVLVRSQGYL